MISQNSRSRNQNKSYFQSSTLDKMSKTCIWRGCAWSSEFVSVHWSQKWTCCADFKGRFLSEVAGRPVACFWWNPVVKTQPASVEERWGGGAMQCSAEWNDLNEALGFTSVFSGLQLINIAGNETRVRCAVQLNAIISVYWEANMLGAYLNSHHPCGAVERSRGCRGRLGCMKIWSQTAWKNYISCLCFLERTIACSLIRSLTFEGLKCNLQFDPSQ